MHPDQKYVAAFNTLELPVFSTKTEVLAQQTNLVKVYSSIDSVDLQKQIEEINGAADLLINEYFAAGK